MKLKKYIFTILLSVFWMNTIISQSIQLLDFNQQTKIEGVTYSYGTKNGISDSNGFINIEYMDNTALLLSHINYGTWSIPDREVKQALQSGKLFKEELNHSLSPITIIALHMPINSQSIVSLDSRDRLAHDGGDILNNIDGFSTIRKSGAYGFDPVFRGFKNDQLNVVINGVQTASAACPNRMDPPTSQVAPNMISYIEVLKGPHSLRYGNSFGATINFVPIAPLFSEKQKIYGRLTSSYETNGSVTRNEGVVGLGNKKFDLALFGSFAKGIDYKTGNGEKVLANFMRASVGANLGLKITKNQNVTLTATRNFARDTDFPALPMDLRSDDTWLISGRHDANFNMKNLKSWNTTLYASLVDHYMDNLMKVIVPRTMNAATPAKTKTFGGRTEGNWQLGRSKLFVGADLRIEKAEGEREREFITGPNAGKTFYDNVWQDGTISKSAIFSEYQLSLTGLTIVFSGRLELNKSGISDIASSFGNMYENTDALQLNPGISVGAIKQLGNKFSMGLWLGRAQRSGSMTERFINYFPVGQDAFELLGNPELKPEINNQLDINFSYKTDKTIVSLDIFTSLLRNNISSVIDTSLIPMFPSSPGVRKFINIDNAYRTGFEIIWKQSLSLYLQQRVSIAYTYGQNRDIDEPLPEIAPMDMRYSISGNLFKGKLHPAVNLRYSLKQGRISADYGETATPAFALVDLNFSYQLNKIINATAGIQNLFDEAYYEHLNRSIPGNPSIEIFEPGRSFFLSLTVDLF
ncbi:MAG: TonB-dependent receptor domain-containing protein [Bacteroidales bacterium]